MINATTQATGSAALQQTAASTANKSDQTKDMFMKLLVAQIKNQNPMSPAEGTEFLQQLSQFTGVEQMTEMRSELKQIRNLLQSFQPNLSSTEAASAASQSN